MQRALRSAAGALAIAIALQLPAGTEARSQQARAEFVRANPCPATGKQRGACPGWEVDHITPLKCSGPDHPSNMQWLTVEQHRKKTAREARLCRKGAG